MWSVVRAQRGLEGLERLAVRFGFGRPPPPVSHGFCRLLDPYQAAPTVSGSKVRGALGLPGTVCHRLEDKIARTEQEIRQVRTRAVVVVKQLPAGATQSIEWQPSNPGVSVFPTKKLSSGVEKIQGAQLLRNTSPFFAYRARFPRQTGHSTFRSRIWSSISAFVNSVWWF